MYYAKQFPEDRFDPNILMLIDGLGIVSAVGPLGLVYMAHLGEFEIKKKQFNKTKAKTLWRKDEWGYNAIALYWGLPSARVVEAVLHPDYYEGPLTIAKMVSRIEKMLKQFVQYGSRHDTPQRYATFFKWFDKAFTHVEYKPYRDMYYTEGTVISSNPKEYRFFPYAFRFVEDITLDDYYERKDRAAERAGRRTLPGTTDPTD